MNKKSTFAFLMAFTLLFSQLAIAGTPNFEEIRQFFIKQDKQKVEKKKLPPVNYIRSREIDVKHVLVDLKFDWDKEQAFGTTAITVAPFKNTSKIYLDAAFMTINSVKLASGTALKFNYAGKDSDNNLEIMLDREYKAGEDLTVKIDYKTNYVNTADTETAIGSFGRGLRFIKPTADEPSKPYQIWSQGETEFNRYWFPSYDNPNDFRTSEVKATVEKKYSVISNGKLVSDTPNTDGTHTVIWKMDQPYSNYLTSIVVGEYTNVEQVADGIPVYNFGYKNEAKQVAETVKRLPDTINFFSKMTGVKYAYPKYSQTFVEDFGGGMENISATTQIEEMIKDEREMLDEDSDSLQAHELAHQWFGDYVTCRDWGQIWLNESFATYFEALYREYSKGHDEFLYDNVRSNQNVYYGDWKQGNRRPIVTKYYANKDAMFDNYAYPRGGAVLHMLRKHLGDENWWKAINHYLVSNAHQPVSTEDFRIAIEESTGESMDWFFDQWLYKMGHPVFVVTQSYENGKVTLNVKQTQKIDENNEFPQAEFFQMFVDVAIDNKVQRVFIKPQAENVFTFDSATKPKLVNFDYEGTLIKELTFEKSTDDLIYQLANDKNILGRRWAMGELEKNLKNEADKPKIIAAILNSVEKDASWQIKRAAITVIGKLNSPGEGSPLAETPATKLDEATIQTMTKAAKDAKSLVRADAIRLLGETREAKLESIYNTALNDQSYTVMENAAVALGKAKIIKSYDALMKLTATESWRGHYRIAGLQGLGALGDKRAFDTAYKYATDVKQDNAIRSAATILIAETGRGDARAYPLIKKGFDAALTTFDLQGMFNGMEAIIKLADPRGQEVFDSMKVKFKDNQQFMGYINILESAFKANLKK
jgi:aminopeptidase N